MLKRRLILAAFVCALVLTLKAIPAQAQEPTHYTYVSLWAVPRAQWADFEKSLEQEKPILERLLAEGTLVAWGHDASLVHTEEGYTHADWFVSTSQAGILKALEALRSSATRPALVSATKHQDLFLHSIAHGGKSGSASSGVIRVAFWQAKPGRGEDLEGFFKKYIQPDLDADVAAGRVLMYNFDSEQIHTDPAGGYDLAVVYANGEALDFAQTRLAAHVKESPAVGAGFVSLQEMEKHRDSLARILAFQHK